MLCNEMATGKSGGRQYKRVKVKNCENCPQFLGFVSCLPLWIFSSCIIKLPILRPILKKLKIYLWNFKESLKLRKLLPFLRFCVKPFLHWCWCMQYKIAHIAANSEKTKILLWNLNECLKLRKLPQILGFVFSPNTKLRRLLSISI